MRPFAVEGIVPVFHNLCHGYGHASSHAAALAHGVDRAHQVVGCALIPLGGYQCRHAALGRLALASCQQAVPFCCHTILLCYAVTLYLAVQLRGRDAGFFYINLGLSRRKLQLSVLLVDFAALAILLTIVLLLHG